MALARSEYVALFVYIYILKIERALAVKMEEDVAVHFRELVSKFTSPNYGRPGCLQNLSQIIFTLERPWSK